MDAQQNRRKIYVHVEGKVLRNILQAVNGNGVWQRRYNFEIHELSNQLAHGSDIVKTTKLSRLRWTGYVVRSDSQNPIQTIIRAIEGVVDPIFDKRMQLRKMLNKL